MNLPDNLKYTNDHEWISVEGNIATIGITDFAQAELGDIVFVDIDADLTEVAKGQSVGTIEAVKTVSDLLGPLTGKVVELNSALTDSPELINTDPYGEGWMLKIEFNDPSELNEYLDGAGYKNLIGQ